MMWELRSLFTVGEVYEASTIDQREVVVLHRLYGFSQVEIAAILGGTEAGVRQKLYRALKALRARVAATEEGT